MPTPEHKLPYREAQLVKPSPEAKDQRWMIVWWQFSLSDDKLIRRRQGFDLNTIDSLIKRKQRADQLIKAINKTLKKGFVHDPEAELQQEMPAAAKPGHLSTLSKVLDAYDYFYQERVATGLAKGTLDGYCNLRTFLDTWLREIKQPGLRLAQFTERYGDNFCQWQASRPSRRGTGTISNKTYNNYYIYLSAFFNWLIEQRVLKRKNHPLKNQKKKKATRSTQHRPYTNEQLQAILNLCRTRGLVQMELYLQFLYYTFARPRSEVRLIQIEDLRSNTIWIKPQQDKARIGRHVDIPPALEALIRQHGLRKLPGHYYIFGVEGKPGPASVGITTMFNQFQILLSALSLAGQSYDLYGFKHTGNINLYLATKDLYAVMRQNGHTSLSMTERYLRDLGVLQNETVMSSFPIMGGPLS